MQIFICGDSTAASYRPEETRMVGWGQLLGDYLPGITVVNLAMAGAEQFAAFAARQLEAMDLLRQSGPGKV